MFEFGFSPGCSHCDQLRDERNRLEDALEEKDNELDRLHDQITELEDRVRELEDDVEHALDTLGDMKAERNDAHGRIDDLEGEAAVREEELEQLSADYTRLRKAIRVYMIDCTIEKCPLPPAGRRATAEDVQKFKDWQQGLAEAHAYLLELIKEKKPDKGGGPTG